MRAVAFDPSSEGFRLAELPVPDPGPGDVLLRVDCCGLNPVDAKIALWRFLAPDMDADWVPGLDVAGEVVTVGPGVSGWRPGDRVLTHGNMFRPQGGFAEYTVQAAATLVPHPDVPSEVAAATPCAGWTAWRALNDKLRAQAGQSILIAGGAGGVGSFAVQIARELGLAPIIATCSAANRDYVLGLGATDALDYRATDVVAEVRDLTGGRGVDRGLDCVGGDNDRLVADALAFEGEMVELVDLVRPAAYEDAFMRGLSFHQLSLGAGHRNGPTGQETLTRTGREFSAWLEAGRLRVGELRTISLDETPDALVAMLDRRTVGKIVLQL